ncbi:MAG TPA: cyclase family protein [Rhodobacterales bacterium]|nr:cyclase family protein [Rhodobacterales bacterium]
MCDICVMNAVKTKMLSRRNFFKSAAGGALAAAAGTGLAGAASAASHGGGGGMSPMDMTHTYDADFPTYFGAPGISVEQNFNFAEHGFNLKTLTINEHTGTHIDAPLHFSADGKSVDEIPVENLVAPLCVIDIKARAAENADAQVTPDDIKAWMAEHGEIPAGACVAMNSGWDKHVASDKFRGADAEGKMHFPGFHIEATKMLMEETGAASMAVDTLSLDYGVSADFATHYAWLPSGRFGIENIANLDMVPATGATLVIGAPKHRGGTGGPARLIALM